MGESLWQRLARQRAHDYVLALTVAIYFAIGDPALTAPVVRVAFDCMLLGLGAAAALAWSHGSRMYAGPLIGFGLLFAITGPSGMRSHPGADRVFHLVLSALSLVFGLLLPLIARRAQRAPQIPSVTTPGA